MSAQISKVTRSVFRELIDVVWDATFLSKNPYDMATAKSLEYDRKLIEKAMTPALKSAIKIVRMTGLENSKERYGFVFQYSGFGEKTLNHLYTTNSGYAVKIGVPESMRSGSPIRTTNKPAQKGKAVKRLTQAQKDKQVDNLTDEQYKLYSSYPSGWSHEESYAMALSGSKKQVRTNEQDTDFINRLYEHIQTTMENLSGRWADEGQHEDIDDYLPVIEKAIGKKNLERMFVVNMTKKPFGFVMQMADTGFRYKFSCSGKTYKWGRV